jgi:Ca2+-binding EF-hand superfamily protein
MTTFSRQVTGCSTTGSLDTPTAAARPAQVCSAQSLPSLGPSRPSLLDVAVEIHRYAKEMAVPLESMRTAFSLFKVHAVVPPHGSLLTDGYLTRSSFVPLFRQMLGEGAASYDDEDVDLFLDRALRKADNDDNGVLSFREFAIWYSSHCFVEGFHLDADEVALRKLARKLGVSPPEIDVYKRHFDTFDADGSGSIDAEEFQEVLYRCGNVPRHIGLPTSRINQLWMAADIDSSGEIDFEEFVIFFRKYFQKSEREGDRTGFERYYSQGLASLVCEKSW